MLLLLIGLVLLGGLLSAILIGLLDIGGLIFWPRWFQLFLGIALAAWLVGDK